MVAVPIDYGDDGLDDVNQGTPRIDWASIEAANAGVHLPAETDKDYTRRILFSRVRYPLLLGANSSVWCLVKLGFLCDA